MNAAQPPYETGVIHGRFQILHNDHLRYLLAGKKQCRRLVVGITNPDPFTTKKEETNPERSDPLANPLTYHERYTMIRVALTEAGVEDCDLDIVPFPINMTERYRFYVPMDAVFFLSIYDDWGRRKHRYFSSIGLKTHVLWEVPPEEKGISATDIRRQIVNDQPWQHLVPACVPPLIERWGLRERLRNIEE